MIFTRKPAAPAAPRAWRSCSQSQVLPGDLAELVRFRAYQTERFTVPVGWDADGRPIWCDLRKAPHVLISGATGSGKSVSINAIISALTIRNSPATLRLVTVDPKQVELTIWDDLPHLLQPVAVDPAEALAAIERAEREMIRRLQAMRAARVQDLDDLPQRLPRLVVVVDEFASISTDKAHRAAILPHLCEIARKGRAAGVHLILSTQYPSAETVPTQIRANIPTRLAFRAMTATESRVAIDTKGAELLPGCGAGLYRDSLGRLVQFQGTYTTSAQAAEIVRFYRSQL